MEPEAHSRRCRMMQVASRCNSSDVEHQSLSPRPLLSLVTVVEGGSHLPMWKELSKLGSTITKFRFYRQGVLIQWTKVVRDAEQSNV